jgi:hypothetical protein
LASDPSRRRGSCRAALQRSPQPCLPEARPAGGGHRASAMAAEEPQSGGVGPRRPTQARLRCRTGISPATPRVPLGAETRWPASPTRRPSWTRSSTPPPHPTRFWVEGGGVVCREPGGVAFSHAQQLGAHRPSATMLLCGYGEESDCAAR